MPQIPKPKRLEYIELTFKDGRILTKEQKAFIITANISNIAHYKSPHILISAWNAQEMYTDASYSQIKEDYPNNHKIYIYKKWVQLP